MRRARPHDNKRSLVILLTCLVFALFVYRMVLHGCIIIGVHGLSSNKATLIVLIIPMFFIGLDMLGLIIFLLFTGAEALGGYSRSSIGFLERVGSERILNHRRNGRVTFKIQYCL